MKLRVLVAAATVLVLAGCGSVHPGAAAVVGDTTISMERADDVATVYCQLTLLSAAEGTPIDNADVRRQAVTDLVAGIVAREMAEEANLTINPSSYEVSPTQRKEIAQAFPDGQLDRVVEAINDSQRTYAIAEQLGAKEVDAPDVEAEQLVDQGLQMIQAEVARRDVRFDPRFGISGDGTQKAATGSLSVPVKAPESNQKGLPATQQCSA
jgi:hypothetical protein